MLNLIADEYNSNSIVLDFVSSNFYSICSYDGIQLTDFFYWMLDMDGVTICSFFGGKFFRKTIMSFGLSRFRIKSRSVTFPQSTNGKNSNM